MPSRETLVVRPSPLERAEHELVAESSACEQLSCMGRRVLFKGGMAQRPVEVPRGPTNRPGRVPWVIGA